MPWTPRGMVFVPDGRLTWARTHAQLPTVIDIDGEIRVYFGTRDKENRSRSSFVELDRRNLSHVIRVHETPVIDLGAPGTHDEDGVIVSHVVPDGDDLLMYYGGVSRGGLVSYRMAIGLARSTDRGLTFERVFAGPIVDRTPHEAYMTFAPFVRRHGDLWTMWYGSGTSWTKVNGKLEPQYVIKMATSNDGVLWHQPNHTCITALHPLEAVSRPSVLETAHGFEMWFTHRDSRDYRSGNGGYRIGHAVSEDGRVWTRLREPEGLAPSGDGWNTKAMAYPQVLVIDGERVMFHNGDGFGQTGFGYATWSDS